MEIWNDKLYFNLQQTWLIQLITLTLLVRQTSIIQLQYNLSFQLSMVEKDYLQIMCNNWAKTDSCIIRSTKCIPTRFRRKANQYNVIHSDKPTDTTRECSSQPSPVHSEYLNSDPKNIHAVWAIMGRLNHHTVDNGDIEVYTSYYPL